MIAQVASIGWGIDSFSALSTQNCLDIRRAGGSFVARYLPGLTVSEIDTILGSQLALIPIAGYARGGEWGQATGQSDGMRDVTLAHALGIPEGVYLWLDCEGEGGSVADWLAYITAWAYVVTAAGYKAGVYEGAGVPLSGAQWYSIAGVTGYWESCSVVPRVGTCGPMMLQWHSFNLELFDTTVDLDFVGPDSEGRMLVWCAAA